MNNTQNSEIGPKTQFFKIFVRSPNNRVLTGNFRLLHTRLPEPVSDFGQLTIPITVTG